VATIPARESRPRGVYRQTRGAVSGAFLLGVAPGRRMRLVRSLRSRVALRASEVGLLRDLERHPDRVLFRLVVRGTDPTTSDRFEVKRWVLVEPDRLLRVLQSCPGYR
jgi:hypothetical protein